MGQNNKDEPVHEPDVLSLWIFLHDDTNRRIQSERRRKIVENVVSKSLLHTSSWVKGTSNHYYTLLNYTLLSDYQTFGMKLVERITVVINVRCQTDSGSTYTGSLHQTNPSYPKFYKGNVHKSTCLWDIKRGHYYGRYYPITYVTTVEGLP